MRRLLIAIALFSGLTLQARKWTPDEVKDVIRKVNTYWQTNNPAEVRSFLPWLRVSTQRFPCPSVARL